MLSLYQNKQNGVVIYKYRCITTRKQNVRKMRTKFFAIAALVLGLASCQKDFAPEANFGGEIDFQLAVSAPELSKTRAGDDGAVDTNNAMDSAFGAIDYLDGASDGVNHDRVDWNDVDIRYSLEVYDQTHLYVRIFG